MSIFLFSFRFFSFSYRGRLFQYCIKQLFFAIPAIHWNSVRLTCETLLIKEQKPLMDQKEKLAWLSQKLIGLEEQCAHQDKLLQDLNNVVYAQQQHIDKLTARLERWQNDLNERKNSKEENQASPASGSVKPF
jgi:uncharacterized coiled-coil protein SlyX